MTCIVCPLPLTWSFVLCPKDSLMMRVNSIRSACLHQSGCRVVWCERYLLNLCNKRCLQNISSNSSVAPDKNYHEFIEKFLGEHWKEYDDFFRDEKEKKGNAKERHCFNWQTPLPGRVTCTYYMYVQPVQPMINVQRIFIPSTACSFMGGQVLLTSCKLAVSTLGKLGSFYF